MRLRKPVGSVLLVASITAGLVACGTTETSGMHGSRAELYNSVEAISADSSLVAVVTVKSQDVLKAATDRDIPYTLSTVSVVTTYAPEGLGTENLEGSKASVRVEAGSEIVVRQMGTSEIDTPAPVLKAGENYLLFLHPTMLEGEAASQFYVTGGSAGIYAAPSDAAFESEDGQFIHGPFEEGDTLPPTLTAQDLQQ